MATYDPSIPVTNHDVVVDVPQIQENFESANTIIAKDHYAFDDNTAAKQGLHKKVTFPEVQPSAPVLSSGQGAVYTRTISGRTEACYTSSSAETQITSAGLPIWKGGTVGGTGVVEGTIYNAGDLPITHGIIRDYGNMILPINDFGRRLEFKWGHIIPTGGAIDDLFFQFATPFGIAPLQVTLQGVKDSSSVHSIYIKDPATFGNFNLNGFRVKSDDTWGRGFYYFAIGLT